MGRRTEYQKKYYRKNAERIAEYRHKYYWEHAEELREKARIKAKMRKESKKGQIITRDGSKKVSFAIYDTHNDDMCVLVADNLAEIGKYLGRTPQSVSCSICKRNLVHHRYEIVRIEDDWEDEEDEELFE